MLEISYLAFYVLLHLVLAALLLPVVYGLSRSRYCPPPGMMLRIWTGLALILFLMPLLLLQPWGLDQQLLPWFHGSMASVLTLTEPTVSFETIAAESMPIRQHQFALLPQIIYLLAPAFWLWLLLPLYSMLKAISLLRSYLASRYLVRTAQTGELLPELLEIAAPLPVKVHPNIHSPMLLGLRQPLILLPTVMVQQCQQQELHHVLRHEHSHWQQGDLAAFYLQQWLGIICWWSPCWRLLCNEWLRCRELRADANVLAALPDQAAKLDYAQTLLNCSAARTVLQSSQLPSASASASTLALRWLQQPLLVVRIQAVLTPSSLRCSAFGLGAFIGTALMVAVRRQHSNLVEILLAAGADVNVSSRGDGNALIIASQLGDHAMAKRLLEAGADVNAVVLADETALINASYRGDLAMVQLLLDAGAQINLQVETPLSDGRVIRSALNRAATAEMRAFLLSRGAR